MAIEYRSKSGYSKRTVEPSKLLFKYSSWYLYAFCLEEISFVCFRMSSIKVDYSEDWATPWGLAVEGRR